ncbi:MAG: phosphatase PAP2 family protein [Sulfolobales archaeon]|nr:phosphatase PAP2 family protein [Sulfolobales archaeon]MCX8209173.1 phosphatase PAP2 family protein [Sulfolobales archaeon]MDW8010642.1 phosphatase PAP2 family protein [Sulfolobales archaeon]
MYVCSLPSFRCLRNVCYSVSALLVALLVVGVLLDDVSIWKLFSALGEELVYVGLTLALAYVLDPELGVVALSSILLSGSLNVFLKYFFNIPRPPPELWRTHASGPGFPSGHAQVASTFWSLLAATARPSCLIAVSSAVVASVAYSRIGLRVHSVVDVVAGVGVGVAIALAVGAVLRYVGFERAFLLLSLLSTAISYRNTALGYESGVSASILGLGAGLVVSLPALRRSVRILKDSALKERATMLAAVYAVAYTAVIQSNDLPLGGRLLTYFALGILLASTPVVWRKLGSSARTYLTSIRRIVLR